MHPLARAAAITALVAATAPLTLTVPTASAAPSTARPALAVRPNPGAVEGSTVPIPVPVDPGLRAARLASG